MRGKHHNLIVTTTVDETGEERPLFAFPVQVCKATGSSDVRFDRATPSGAEYDTVYRDQVTGEIVTNAEMVKGVRTGDSFQVVPDEQIKAINEALASTEMRALRSVPLDGVPMERATGFYYIQVPEVKKGKGASPSAVKSYRLTYEALLPRAKKGKKAARPAKALVVKFVSTSRQKLAVIYADPKAECLVLVTLTFAADVREPDEQVKSHLAAEVDQGMVDKACEVIDALDDDGRGDFSDPVDEAIEKREALVEAALAGEAIDVPTPELTPSTDADDLLAALDASIESVKA